ncbi:MAG: germination protein YpeB [Clostridia bacterium]|nr:germination protein YpeB [Clostridia bacterium]
MEKKKNNAVEKAEQVADKNDETRAQKSSKKKNVSVKSVNNSQKKANKKKMDAQKKRKVREQKRAKIKEEREKARVEKEQMLAEKRLENARLKAHRKAEKQKAKATMLREKNRRKAELEKRRQELKAEQKARKEMLKSESKKDREARIEREKSAKREAIANKRKEKAEKRARVLAYKKAKREQKARERSKNKDRRRGFGGWLAAVISLSVATLVLASVLTFTFLTPTTEDNLLEAGYQKSFYDTVEQVDNIDLNLSKVLATADSGAMQKYLVDTAINSELAENDLQQLPLQDESKYYTTKLINQIGDYAKYLNGKLINGESLSKEDYQSLERLYRANLTLKESLGRMVSDMGEKFSFSSMLENGNGNIVVKGFDELQNLSVQYPELIYDGPFSDGLNEREIKGLKGEEISEEQAREKFSQIFADFAVTDVKSVGSASGDIECYNVQANLDGEVLYAQVSKKGGELIMFSYSGSCNAVYCDGDDATEIAKEFLSKLGYKDMKAVWINLSNNVYTINFAFEQDGVIVYSDLVKVRVCAETQSVIGLEARTYFTNHTQRVIAKASLTKAQAVAKVSTNIQVKTARLAVVPIGQKSEKLCYEIHGEYDGSTYYVYIDATTGRQVEMFKVIESTEGTLLI